jgi:hypothetical protein
MHWSDGTTGTIGTSGTVFFYLKGDSMTPDKAYQPKQFKLAGLSGISDQTLDMHFKFYEGYVKETNREHSG